MSNISFAKVGAGVPAPVPAEIPVVPPEAERAASRPDAGGPPAANAAAQPTSALAAPRPAGVTQLGFYTGEDDSVPETDFAHLKLPRLNIVQGMSQASFKAFGLGEFIFKGAVKLPQPVRVVCCGFAPVTYVEDVKFGTRGRIAKTPQEVAAMGGTTEWKFSKKNEKIDSRLPWFVSYTNGMFLVEQPAGTDPDYFPYAAGGKAYALALFALKSVAFGDVYLNGYQAEKLTGVLRNGGYSSRVAELRAVPIPGYDGSFKPALRFVEPSSPELRDLARRCVTGQ